MQGIEKRSGAFVVAGGDGAMESGMGAIRLDLGETTGRMPRRSGGKRSFNNRHSASFRSPRLENASLQRGFLNSSSSHASVTSQTGPAKNDIGNQSMVKIGSLNLVEVKKITTARK